MANRASVRGATPQGVQTSAEATAVQPIGSAPAIALDKTAVVSGSGSVGSRVTYRFDVTNTGMQTVSGVAVEDRGVVADFDIDGAILRGGAAREPGACGDGA